MLASQSAERDGPLECSASPLAGGCILLMHPVVYQASICSCCFHKVFESLCSQHFGAAEWPGGGMAGLYDLRCGMPDARLLLCLQALEAVRWATVA
jgi:hypothetical protein